jgi:glycosyltransferase involved in cell wall biosynthesis
LVQRKGFDVLLKALARLEPPANDFKLELAGDGPEREVLRSLAADLGLADRVEFLGEVDDVPSHFAQAQLLVHPSFSEGLSNTILEAMAEGLPVIATSVGATAEYIEPGRTGALVPPGNVEALASALTELLRAPEARGRMGVAALESVRSRCSMDVVTAQYEAVYNELLDGLASARTPVSAQS